MSRASPWIVRMPGPDDSAATLRLLCFPYAGGAAHVYADWRQSMPQQVLLQVVQLPGRGARFRDAPLRSIGEMALGVMHALLQDPDPRPLVFFGHSMGALVAFETARLMRRSGMRLPRRLLVSGYIAPHLGYPEPPIHALSDAEFGDRLREYEGTPAEVLQHPELLSLLMPMVRADFAAVETYTYQTEGALPCPIAAFGGRTDTMIPEPAIAAWREQTRGGFSMQMFDGGHFFIHTARDALLARVVADIEKTLENVTAAAVVGHTPAMEAMK
ncbi:MAG: alpha/beta fold hydrolase [Lysobacteraceae bacterium]